jgi:tRNA-dihydrouridine synthase
VRAALPASIPVIGNGDVKDLAAYRRMKAETGCDGVMIGRGAMGNPWLFRSLVALEEGRPDPGPPSLAERRRVWRRHADLVGQHSPAKMRLHELRKTLAWYSRGLYGGSHLRQRTFTTSEPAALLEIGEAFFDHLSELAQLSARGPSAGLSAPEETAQSVEAVVLTPPDDPVAKSIARNGRRGGVAGWAGGAS